MNPSSAATCGPPPSTWCSYNTPVPLFSSYTPMREEYHPKPAPRPPPKPFATPRHTGSSFSFIRPMLCPDTATGPRSAVLLLRPPKHAGERYSPSPHPHPPLEGPPTTAAKRKKKTTSPPPPAPPTHQQPWCYNVRPKTEPPAVDTVPAPRVHRVPDDHDVLLQKKARPWCFNVKPRASTFDNNSALRGHAATWHKNGRERVHRHPPLPASARGVRREPFYCSASPRSYQHPTHPVRTTKMHVCSNCGTHVYDEKSTS
eukprot:PhM_4_TR10571/c0_g1_i1/m.26415